LATHCAQNAVETIPFDATSLSQRQDAAAILVAALAHVPSAWKNMKDAQGEVATFFGNPERLAIGAVEEGRLVGWIGAIRHSAHAWELHPLVVHPARQGRGCGTHLVVALEDAARRAGACTIWLGTDDDFGGTNLFGQDVYPDVSEHLRRLAPTAGHPFTFYRRLGYTVVGVIPDADGPGKPDILMAKRM